MKRTQTSPMKTGHTPLQKSRRKYYKRPLPLSYSFEQLIELKINRLKQLCEERGIAKRSNTKLVLVAHLLKYISDTSGIEELDDHEVATICHSLDIKGTINERREQLLSYVHNPELTSNEIINPAEYDLICAPMNPENENLKEEVTTIRTINFDEDTSNAIDELSTSLTDIQLLDGDENYLTMNDLVRLRKKDMINDNIIDFWYEKLGEQNSDVIFLSSQIYPLLMKDVNRCAQRLKPKVNFFSSSLMFLPVCECGHWSLYVIKNIQQYTQPTIVYCDSIGGCVKGEIIKQIVLLLQKRLIVEHVETDTIHISPQVVTPTLPLQNNAIDCGLYLLQYTQELLTKDISNICFTDENINNLRDEIRKNMELILENTHQDSTVDSLFEEVDTRTWKQKRIDNLETSDGQQNNDTTPNSFKNWETVIRCKVSELDENRNSYPFTKGSFKSNGIKRSHFITDNPDNKCLMVNGKWPNPLQTGEWSYKIPQKHGNSKIAMYEIFNCTNPLCSQSNKRCSAQWMWRVLFDSTDEFELRCKGEHGEKWISSDAFSRGLTVNAKKTALAQHNQFGVSPGQIARSLGLNPKSLYNFLGHAERKQRFAKNHFEAFKILIGQLIDNESYEVMIPGGMENMKEEKFSVIILSKALIEFAVENGRIFETIGHDGVYKLTDLGVPVNVYTTVTSKGFNGIVLGYSIASSNSAQMLKPLLTAFLVYLRQTYPTKYRQPMFMVDEEEGQLNALKELKLGFSICRFHLVRCWRKHIQKKVDNEHRSAIANCLLRLLITQNESDYNDSYKELVDACGTHSTKFLDYFNREHHHLSKHWNLSDRCLRNNSLGSTNNITESAIRLIEKNVQDDQERKHKFQSIKKNETIKNLQSRLEDSKALVSQVEDRLESPFMFQVGDYGVNIQYCYCTCLDYLYKGRICKHINAALIYFAKKQNMNELPRDAYEFHDKVLSAVQSYQNRFTDTEKLTPGRPVSVSRSARKFGRPKTNKSLSSFVETIDGYSEIDRIIGISRSMNGKVQYNVEWSDGSDSEWIDCLEASGTDKMARQFLKDMIEAIDDFDLVKSSKLRVVSVLRERGKYRISYDGEKYEELSIENAMSLSVFVAQFNL